VVQGGALRWPIANRHSNLTRYYGPACRVRDATQAWGYKRRAAVVRVVRGHL